MVPPVATLNRNPEEPMSDGVFYDQTRRARCRPRSAMAEDTLADCLGLCVASNDLPMTSVIDDSY